MKLGFNAFYTGFLFKDTAYINPGPFDTKNYNLDFDWSEFADTYFAPRHLMASLYGEFPGLPFGRGQLFAALMAQFDLSDAGEKYHTQYLLVRHNLMYKVFDLAVSGAAELTNTEEDGLKPAFAASVEAGLQLPTAIRDRISLSFEWASGDGKGTAAFYPVTNEARSYVLKPALSGIMIIKANYHMKPFSSLSADIGGSYFIRNDFVSFSAPYLEDDSYPLGLELGAGLLWVPISDISLTIKGGVFLPETGSAWSSDAPMQWRITAGTIFSF